MGQVSDVIVPYGLRFTPYPASPFYWRRVGLFCLYDTTRYSPLEAEWLDDVFPTDIVLV